MKDELVNLIEALPKDTAKAEWIFMIKYSANTLDTVSNVLDLERRRQILASVDQTWSTLIKEEKRKEEEKRQGADKNAFIEERRSHYDERE